MPELIVIYLYCILCLFASNLLSQRTVRIRMTQMILVLQNDIIIRLKTTALLTMTVAVLPA